jgi:hypothetical protein
MTIPGSARSPGTRRLIGGPQRLLLARRPPPLRRPRDSLTLGASAGERSDIARREMRRDPTGMRGERRPKEISDFVHFKKTPKQKPPGTTFLIIRC